MKQATREINGGKSAMPRGQSGSGGCRSKFLALIVIVGVVLIMTEQRLERDRLLSIIAIKSDKSETGEADSGDSKSTSSSSGSSKSYLRRRSSVVSEKFPTFPCPEYLNAESRLLLKELSGGISDPNEGVLHARRTSVKSNFWISLHKSSFDSLRWRIMDSGNYYEYKQSEAFVEILQQQRSASSPLHLVDVGGNIGWYSLLSVAAALEVNRSITVDVFEPNPRNRYRMCESLALNHWINNEKVDFHLYPLGVSSSSGGVVPMMISQSGTGKLGRVSDKNVKENVDIHLVSLDDMSKEFGWFKTPIDILKVDVEGLELEVFEGAKRLLQSGQVKNIFFEGNSRNGEEVEKFHSIIKLFVRSGYYAYKHGGWNGAETEVVAKPVVVSSIGKGGKKQSKVATTAKGGGGEDDEAKLQAYIDRLTKECNTDRVDNNPSHAQCNLWWRKISENESPSSSS